MLTPLGMRQRYLLGKYNKFMLDRPFGFNKTVTDLTENNYSQVNMLSTGKPRTLQSGYAELLGFTNGGVIDESLQLSQKQ
jgi:hypothetical protein